MIERKKGSNDSVIEHGFLSPVGSREGYHALFAEAMQYEVRRRLGEDHLRSLYDKASLWYEQHGLLTEAIEVALYARNFARAAMLIERLIEPQPLNDEFHTLHRWIEELPEEVLQAYPALCLTYAMTLLYSHDRSAPATRALVEVPLHMAEHYWRAKGNRHKLGEVLALRSQRFDEVPVAC